jgi:hypothetical protein
LSGSAAAKFVTTRATANTNPAAIKTLFITRLLVKKTDLKPPGINGMLGYTKTKLVYCLER